MVVGAGLLAMTLSACYGAPDVYYGDDSGPDDAGEVTDSGGAVDAAP